MSLTVSHEDEILLDADYTPVYDVEPGSCGAESRTGTLVVEVLAPGA